jgi:hypothetical protein
MILVADERGFLQMVTHQERLNHRATDGMQSHPIHQGTANPFTGVTHSEIAVAQSGGMDPRIPAHSAFIRVQPVPRSGFSNPL